ncbi:AP2 domain-containing protein [Burkholderia sp. HI2500]|uniref:AP2 domain-containing protein n=1 Tax=Burkholderia sp. HI2500 TaxID=2015358 RepID=UPI0015C68089|nr:AP2 domain-containing protein [Burkholderia sp. HI2500]
MGAVIDLAGMKFGRWTVLRIGEKKGKQFNWLCLCECGAEALVAGQSLRKGRSLSCGCLRKEVNSELHRTHGMAKTKLNVVWSGMKARCGNPKHEMFHRYGGRGIKVCERWQSFERFYEDMGSTYQEGLSIERIDNDGDYEPGNCRWATTKEQRANQAHPKIQTPVGEMTIREASEVSGINLKTLRHRVWRGWPAERLFAPLGSRS